MRNINLSGRRPKPPCDVVVRSLSKRASVGIAMIGPLVLRCGLGRSGMTHLKREGDGATPIGRWRVLRILYRPDRKLGFLAGELSGASAMRPADGWCDAVSDRNYNRQVRHPYPASAEELWRPDQLYDVIVVLDHNQCPRVKGAGSAIFMHLARANSDGSIAPTAGCVSLRRRDLAHVLARLRPGSAVRIVA